MVCTHTHTQQQQLGYTSGLDATFRCHAVVVNRPETASHSPAGRGGNKVTWMETRRADGQFTHVVFGWVAPLLHVHDFHVQHSPKLHLDPAKALHKRVGGRRLLRLQISCPVSREGNHSTHRCQLTIQRSVKTSARWRADGQLGLPSADATIID